jgi:hypothetical protein
LGALLLDGGMKKLERSVGKWEPLSRPTFLLLLILLVLRKGPMLMLTVRLLYPLADYDNIGEVF